MTEAFVDAKGSTTWFTSFGLRIGVHSNDPGVLEYLTARRPASWRPTGPGRGDRLYSLSGVDDGPGHVVHVVSVGPLTIARGHTLDQVMGAVELDARHFVAEFARRRVFVHAGAVGIGGRAVVIPGRSGTGKSTLVAALVGRGATYYSDEYAVFDQAGRIHPYPKALSLRADNGLATEPVELGTSRNVRHPPLPLGAVLCISFAGADTTWQPRSESAGSAMMALADNAIAIRRQPEKTLSYLQRALVGVDVLVGPRGEAEPTAEAVIRVLEARWR